MDGDCEIEIESSDDRQHIINHDHTNISNITTTAAATTAPAAASATAAAAAGNPDSALRKVGKKVWVMLKWAILLLWSFMLCAFMVCAYLPVYLTYVAWIEMSITSAFNKKKDDKRKPGVFTRTVEYETIKEKMFGVNGTVLVRFGSVLVLWLLVTLFVPSIKESTVLGSPHWKWTLFALMLPWVHIVVIFLIFLMTLFPGSLCKLFKEKYKVEYYVDGLAFSFSAVLSFGMVLVAWLIYFRSGNGFKEAWNEKVLEFGTWTFVSLFLGAILWFIKRSLLLHWNANAIYDRFKSNILVAGFQLYFVALLTDDKNSSFKVPRWGVDRYNYKGKEEKGGNKLNVDASRDYMLNQEQVTLFQLKVVARWVTDHAMVITREDKGTIEVEVERKLQEKIQQHSRLDHMTMTKQDLEKEFKLDPKDAQLLYAELMKSQNQSDEKEITYDKFIKWMVNSHKNCLTLGYTLVDSEAAADSLNLILKISIIVAVIFLWILFTDLATTEFLVLLVSPAIALSFVFGDTAKSFFQGIIFSFVSHPFDVGDRCIIDGVETEVKRIGILTTTFKRMGSKENFLYPNSELATKTISNFQGQPDPDDEIELELDYATGRIQIPTLLKKIKEFFHNNILYESHHLVIVKAISDKIKIVVQFTHKMSNDDVTHSQYFNKKTQQRSHLLAEILSMIEDPPDQPVPTEQVLSTNKPEN